ncbi:MAG: DUF859 family phage minor structural protein [Eubacteriaceae bacterium]
MALSGSTRIKDGNTYDWYIVWSATQNIAANTSTVTARLEVRKMAANPDTFGLGKTSKIKIQNDSIKTSTWDFDMRDVTVYYPTAGSYQTVISDTYTIAHNSDGTCSPFTIYAYFDMSSTTVGLVEGYTDSITLNAIPRASIIGTIQPFNLEDVFIVPVTKYSESFTDTLVIKYNSVAIKTIIGYTNNTNISLTDSELLTAYNLIPKSALFTFELTTKSGSTIIGSSSSTATGTAAGTIKTNICLVWKRAVVWLNVSGVWKKTLAKVNVNNAWKRGT